MTYNFNLRHELPKTITLDSLPIWTWDQKEMKDHPLIFPSIFHLHFFDQRWIKYEFLKLSPYFPKLETFRVSSWTSFNPNLNLFDPMIKMDLKYEKYILELMVDQKFTWSTLTLTDFDQNDHFAPLNQLIHFPSKLMIKTSNIWSSKYIEAMYKVSLQNSQEILMKSQTLVLVNTLGDWWIIFKTSNPLGILTNFLYKDFSNTNEML